MLKRTIRAISGRWVAVVARHYWLVAALTIVSLVASLFAASHLTLKTNLSALLPEEQLSVRILEQVQKKIGGLGKLLVVVQSPDSAANDRFARALMTPLASSELINVVEYQRDLSFFEDRKLLYIDVGDLKTVRRRIAQKLRFEKNKRDPLFFIEQQDPGLDFSDIEDKYRANGLSANRVSDDGKTALVVAYPGGVEGNIGFARKLLASAQQIAEGLDPKSFHPEMQLSYGGQFKNKLIEYKVIMDDIASTAIAALIGVMILIALYFRQAFAVFFIGLPLILGMSWTFGITAITIGNLNLITGFLVAVLAGLGIDFGIHTFARYTEDRNGGADPTQAMSSALHHTGMAMATSAWTTSAAFYSLLINDFKGFSEFGFIAGTGVLLSLASVFLTFPAFIFIGERLNLIRHTAIIHKSRGTGNGRFPAPRAVLIVAAIAAVGAAYALPNLTFQYDFSNLRANHPANTQVKRTIRGITQSSPDSPAVIVVEDPDERHRIVEILSERLHDPDTAIESIKTLDQYVPDSQDVKLKVLASIRRLLRGKMDHVTDGTDLTPEQLERWLNPGTIVAADLPDYALRRFRGADGSMGEFVAIYPSVPLTQGKLVIKFADEVRTVKTEKKTYHSSGSAVIFADMLTVMFEDSKIAVSSTLLVVFLILFADFKSKRAALLVLVPLVGGVLLMCGSLVLVGMKLNFYNMVVIPTIIGIGVDSGVHLYHRYLEEGRGSVRLMLVNTGGPVLMTTLTTMLGFSGLLFAAHQGLNSIGKLALIGLGFCLVMSLIVLPAILQYLDDRSDRAANAES